MDLVDQFQEITGATESEAITTLSNHNYNLDSAVTFYISNHTSSHPSVSETSAPDESVPLLSSSHSVDAVNQESQDVSDVQPIERNETSALSSDNARFVQSARRVGAIDGGQTSGLSVIGRRVPFGRSATAASSSDLSTTTGAVSSASSSLSASVTSGGATSGTGVRFYRSSSSSAAASSSSRGLMSRVDTGGDGIFDSIFRPPYDIMFNMDFFYAKDYAKDQDLWLIVNVQNTQNFDCQCLNRDVWSSQDVKRIIRKHFLFLQYRIDSQDGKKYSQFYSVNQFPYIAILDPRTGELLQTFNAITSQNAGKLLMAFVRRNGAPSVSDQMRENLSLEQDIPEVIDLNDDEIEPTIIKVSPSSKNGKQMSEEEELKAAIAASLNQQSKSSSSGRSLGFAGNSTWSSTGLLASSATDPIELSEDETDDEYEVRDGKRERRRKKRHASGHGGDASGSNDVSIGLVSEDDEDEGDMGSPDSNTESVTSDDSRTSSSVASFNPEESSNPTPTESSQKRKRKRGEDLAGSTVSNGPQLNGNLKRLKLEPTLSQSSSSRRSTVESSSLDSSSSGRKGLEVQDIGPLIPPTRHSLESFPTEVSVLPKQKHDSGSCGGDNEQQSGEDTAVANVKILLKCPSGERRTINVTESCTLHSFMAGCGSLGFSDVLYEFTTHFPRRVLNTLDRKVTLADLEIKSNCVVFVESKI